MNLQPTYRLRKGTEAFRTRNGHLFYSPRNHKWVLVNQDGYDILNCLHEDLAISELFGRCADNMALSKEKTASAVSAFIEEQVANGIVQPSHLEAEIDWRAALSLPGLEEVYLEITNQCNLRCRYCYNSKQRQRMRSNGHLPLTKQQWLDLIDTLLEMGAGGFVFSGGEPLLYPAIFDIAEHCKQNNARTTLLTNATLISDDITTPLKAVFDRVEISLDSHIPTENDRVRGEGSFQKIVKGIQTLVHSGHTAVVVKPVLSCANLESIVDLPLFVKNELGCYLHSPTIALPFEGPDGQIDMSLMPDHEQVNTVLARFSNILRECYGATPQEVVHVGAFLSCGVGKRILSIDSTGNIYPCQAMHDQQMLCGNLHQKGIEEIYNTSPILKRLRRMCVLDVQVCKDCKWVLLCGGGCRALALRMYGRVNAYIEEFCGFSLAQGIRSLTEAADRTTHLKSGEKTERRYP